MELGEEMEISLNIRNVLSEKSQITVKFLLVLRKDLLYISKNAFKKSLIS